MKVSLENTKTRHIIGKTIPLVGEGTVNCLGRPVHSVYRTPVTRIMGDYENLRKIAFNRKNIKTSTIPVFNIWFFDINIKILKYECSAAFKLKHAESEASQESSD